MRRLMLIREERAPRSRCGCGVRYCPAGRQSGRSSKRTQRTFSNTRRAFEREGFRGEVSARVSKSRNWIFIHERLSFSTHEGTGRAPKVQTTMTIIIETCGQVFKELPWANSAFITC